MRLKRYLRDNPQEANRLAITHFEDYLELASEYKKLEKQLEEPLLPPLPKQAKLQAEYEELLEYLIELQKANANLYEDNKALRDLIGILTENTAGKRRKSLFFSELLGLTNKFVSRKPKTNTNPLTTEATQIKVATIQALIPLLLVFLVL